MYDLKSEKSRFQQFLTGRQMELTIFPFFFTEQTLKKFFREIPTFFYSVRLRVEFLFRLGYTLRTFTCKRGRMKRGNGGLWPTGDSPRAFNCYPADEIKLKLPANACTLACAYDIASV